jgi:hypothetical protein
VRFHLPRLGYLPAYRTMRNLGVGTAALTATFALIASLTLAPVSAEDTFTLSALQLPAETTILTPPTALSPAGNFRGEYALYRTPGPLAAEILAPFITASWTVTSQNGQNACVMYPSSAQLPSQTPTGEALELNDFAQRSPAPGPDPTYVVGAGNVVAAADTMLCASTTRGPLGQWFTAVYLTAPAATFIS